LLELGDAPRGLARLLVKGSVQQKMFFPETSKGVQETTFAGQCIRMIAKYKVMYFPRLFFQGCLGPDDTRITILHENLIALMGREFELASLPGRM
jgi:hypothetical protein